MVCSQGAVARRGPHTRRMVVPNNQALERQPLAVVEPLEIRPPRIDEAAGAAAVHHRSWVDTYTALVGPIEAARLTLAERIAHWEWLLGSQPTNWGALVAIRSGAIVGLVEWELGVDADTSVGEIHAIHVAVEERSRGVGRRLLNGSMRALRAHGLRRTILWVVEDNSPARAFYERRGWAWDGTRLERPLGGFPGFPAVIEVRYALDLG